MTDQQGPREERVPEPEGLEERALHDPVPVGPGATGPGASAAKGAQAAAADGGTAALLALVDKLTAVLEKSDLGELELTAGETSIIVRSPAAIEKAVAYAAAAPAAAADAVHADAPGAAPVPVAQAAAAVPAGAPAPARPSVKAPLTGIYYGAPSPGATPYLKVGDHVSVGQIIGLIEAMKLFNEIKSDLAGRVVRICAENGALVKAKSPLIEVEPA